MLSFTPWFNSTIQQIHVPGINFNSADSIFKKCLSAANASKVCYALCFWGHWVQIRLQFLVSDSNFQVSATLKSRWILRFDAKSSDFTLNHRFNFSKFYSGRENAESMLYFIFLKSLTNKGELKWSVLANIPKNHIFPLRLEMNELRTNFLWRKSSIL